jgi:RNA polymerase sigma factor (sigma-70 family)
MATPQTATILRQFDQLFGAGTVAGLSDAQLLGRFRAQRDEAAFVALVTRHGPMVLAVCRGVLRDEHAAEDAFQATFLILVRKASVLWVGDSLGGWLHRVAHRVALQARADRVRRGMREKRAGEAAALKHVEEETQNDELRALLHDEIGRLPDRLRLPVVLCDLEGLTRDQAAARLRWTEGTVRGRLARARTLLRERLTRRGVVIPAGALAAVLAREAVAAPVSDTLLTATVRAAVGQGTASAAAMLAAWVMHALLAAKIKAAAAVAVVLTTTLASVAWFMATRAHDGEKPPAPSAGPPAVHALALPGKEPGATVAIRGRVVDPGSRPVQRATVRFFDPSEGIKDDLPTASSGPEGRFDLRVPRGAFDDHTPGIGKIRTRLVATAEGFGFAWSDIAPAPGGPTEVTLRLVADDVPIEGRLVDLEGRPLSGALVKVRGAWFSREGDLSAWIERMQNGVSRGPWQGLDHVPMEIVITSGPDGRFTVAGIGPERIATLLVSGPGVESAELDVMTRNGPGVRIPKEFRVPGDVDYLPARFVHSLAPGRMIEGIVRDKDTGAALAGVEVTGAVYDEGSQIPQPGVEATTDANGRYRLNGLAPAHAYRLFATPAAGSPYPDAAFRVPAGSAAPAPVAFDFALQRGVLIQGQVTDKATGKPVHGYVMTYTFNDNPLLRTFPGYRDSHAPFAQLDADGRFAIAALPGRGLVAVRSDLARYMGPRGIETIKGLSQDRNSFATSPLNCTVGDFHAIVEINPDGGTRSLELQLQVNPGRSVSGTVVDPDGRPIGGTKGAGLTDLFSLTFQPLESAEFEVRGLDPEKPRGLFFVHQGQKLAGSLLIRGGEAGPLLVRLQPWGVVTGRVVDDDGQPRTKLALNGNIGAYGPGPLDPERGILPSNEPLGVDEGGRFRVEGLVPGLKYQLWASQGNMLVGKVFEGVQVSAGETRDLGDVKLFAQPTE